MMLKFFRLLVLAWIMASASRTDLKRLLPP